MARGIRMKTFVTKKMAKAQQDEATQHAQKIREHKRALIARHQAGRPQSKATTKVTSHDGDGQETQKLRQQISRLEREGQQAQAASQRRIKQLVRRYRKLKQDNRDLRQATERRAAVLEEQQRQNDRAATALMKKYVALAGWQRIFADLEIDPFAGESAQTQLNRQAQELQTAQVMMFRLLALAWQRAAANQQRAHQYDRLRSQYDRLQARFDHLQKSYQTQSDELHQLKQRVQREEHDMEAAKRRMRDRYLNGRRLDNAFHILFDHLDVATVQQYGPLVPLLEKMRATFDTATRRNDRHPFVYGDFIQQNGRPYIGDRAGHHLRPLTLTKDNHDLQPGMAIKAQRVDRYHYYVVATMPWVNDLFRYLDDHGAFQPNRLVPTTGTVKLSTLLSDGPSNTAGKPKERVVMGRLVAVASRTFVAGPKAVNDQPIPAPGKRAAMERVTIVNPDKIAWLYAQRLLLIGNQKIAPLVVQLRKYVDLTVMDAYEDSLGLIFTKIAAADYVFVLLGSVPHALTDYLKAHPEYASKVQYFYRADANEAVRRLNYLYMNRG